MKNEIVDKYAKVGQEAPSFDVLKKFSGRGAAPIHNKTRAQLTTVDEEEDLRFSHELTKACAKALAL